MDKKLEAFEQLLKIMDELREKCPWDKQQTFESIRPLTIEETYELTDAIIKRDINGIKKELGDLLLHIVFYAKIGSELNAFDIKDVITSLNEKLIYRHPHVFGSTSVENSVEVERNWEQLKLKEKGGNKSVLAGIPAQLPALVKAYRIQDKARGVGFDWDDRTQIWAKIEEEIQELKLEIDKLDEDKMEDEFGDVFFALINAARLYNINPENALERTNQKFIKRFNYLESKTIKEGKNLHKMTLEEMDMYWNEAKQFEYRINYYPLNSIDDNLLEFGVILATYDNKMVFVQHNERDTWEIPGGHREKGEHINQTGYRELTEETGVNEFDLEPVSEYSVTNKGTTRYGRLFRAVLKKFNANPDSEIKYCQLFGEIPENLTYPDIQPNFIKFLNR